MLMISRVRYFKVVFLAAFLQCTPFLACAADDIEQVKEILKVGKMGELIDKTFRNDIERINLQKPEEYVDLAVYLQFFNPSSIVDRIAPIYSNNISSDYAKKVYASMNTRVGKMNFELVKIENELGFNELQKYFRKLSAADQRAVSDYRRSPVFLSYMNMLDKSRTQARDSINQWINEMAVARIQQVKIVLADMIEADIRGDFDSATQDTFERFKRVPKTGIRHVDQESLISYENLRKGIRLNSAYTVKFKEAALDQILAPQNLISREALERGQLSILTVEALFDAQEKDRAELKDEFDKKFEMILMPASARAEYRKNLDRREKELFGLQIRISESVRQLLEVQKQILNLCEQQLGKVTYKNEKMLFPSRQVLDNYNLLIAQAEKAYAEIDAIEKEDAMRRQRVVQSLRQSKSN